MPGLYVAAGTLIGAGAVGAANLNGPWALAMGAGFIVAAAASWFELLNR